MKLRDLIFYDTPREGFTREELVRIIETAEAQADVIFGKGLLVGEIEAHTWVGVDVIYPKSPIFCMAGELTIVAEDWFDDGEYRGLYPCFTITSNSDAIPANTGLYTYGDLILPDGSRDTRYTTQFVLADSPDAASYTGPKPKEPAA